MAVKIPNRSGGDHCPHGTDHQRTDVDLTV